MDAHMGGWIMHHTRGRQTSLQQQALDLIWGMAVVKADLDQLGMERVKERKVDDRLLAH